YKAFRDRELVFLNQGGEEAVFGFGLDAAALAVGHVLANTGLQIVQTFVVSELLGEVVGKFGKGAFFDALDGYVVGDRLIAEVGFRVVGRVDDFGLEFLAGLGTAEDLGKSLNRILAANLDQGVLPGDRRCFGII